jgi:hypothetical protein
MVRSSSNLQEQARAASLLMSDHRRSSDYLANVLRNADIGTLNGFDAGTGTSAAPAFRRPTGVVGGSLAYGPVETLVWRPSPHVVSGVVSPGDVWLVGPGTETVAAARVPQGGFSVRWVGRTLYVRLTTYHPLAGEEATRVTSTIAASARNF